MFISRFLLCHPGTLPKEVHVFCKFLKNRNVHYFFLSCHTSTLPKRVHMFCKFKIFSKFSVFVFVMSCLALPKGVQVFCKEIKRHNIILLLAFSMSHLANKNANLLIINLFKDRVKRFSTLGFSIN
jgi:ribosomal protein L44E